MSMTMQAVTLRVVVNGVDTDVESINTVHDVNQPIATGSVTFRQPWPVLTELGTPIQVYAGYDGATSLIFNGRLAGETGSYDAGGGLLKMELEGLSTYLWKQHHFTIEVPGMTTQQNLFLMLCNARGVPLYYSERTQAVDGIDVTWGGLPEVNGGYIIIKTDASAGEVLSRYAKHYGYRIFERNHGVLMQMRIGGIPDASRVERVFREGENVLSVEQTRSLDGMANYIEYIGAKYTAGDGAEVALRSIPATVVADPRFGPRGVNKVSFNEPDIVFIGRLHQARQAQEIDLNAPSFSWKWTTTGDEYVTPGVVVALESATVGGYTPLWLMRVQHAISPSGWTTTMEGWSGAGTTLPAGNDCTYKTLVGAQGFHVGNEYLAHYRNPNPIGTQRKVSFTVPNDYSTLNIRGLAHGTNSFMTNTESTASRFELWQTISGEYKKVASGEMPRQNENLAQRLPYGPNNTHWSSIAVPMSGSLKAGAVDLLIVAGNDTTVGDVDDFEVCNLVLETCGVGNPTIIGA